MNCRARTYDPTMGRFLQADPLRFAAKDMNLYRYVRNNPVNFNDPSGRCISPTGIGAILSAIGGFCEGFITDLLFKDGIASPVDIGKAVVRGHHRCSG
jgi:hypothetical protein